MEPHKSFSHTGGLVFSHTSNAALDHFFLFSSIDIYISKEFLTSSQPLSSKQPLEALEFYLFTHPTPGAAPTLFAIPDISYTGQISADLCSPV